MMPSKKWMGGKECPLATHIQKETKKRGIRRRIGQQKQRRLR
jgi:hypothetical protein